MAYPGMNLAKVMWENTQTAPWQRELVPVGAMSTAYQVRRDFRKGAATGFSVEVAFSASPGTFEVDVMAADTDQIGHYVSLAQIVAVNSSFVGRLDVLNVYAKYVALLMKTSPNAGTVLVSAQITR